MIVSFSGPSCSGKTTIVKALKEKLDAKFRIEVIDETARMVFMEKFKEYRTLDKLREDKEAFLDFEIEIIRRQIKEEERAVAKAEIVFADRSIYDTYAYSKIYLPENLFTVFLDFFERHARRKYDLLFLCCPLPPVEDGFRSVKDIASQKIQYELIKEVIKKYHGDFQELPWLSIEERLNFILNFLPIPKWR
ncbi:MAG: ATP-binding protein [Archaeoglobaceae archaeon]|nr:ATP-binding protein [Archaeoglobaceae archaeon]